MPISADRMKLYPGGSIHSPEWQAIRERVGNRSGWRCEECQVQHGETVCRAILYGREVYMIPADGETFDADTGERLGHHHLYDAVNPRMVKIVLTVAHVDGDETNSADDNLRHWCQLHHNRHDAKSRAANAAKTRRTRSGQVDLEDLL